VEQRAERLANVRVVGWLSPSELTPYLYASDLLGGCIGSLLATLFLIPMLGLSASALLTAIIILLAILLV